MFFGSDDAGEAPRAEETVSQLDKAVIPGEPNDCGRDPWFDRPFGRLTVLSRVEGGIQESGEKIKLFWISRRLRREMTNRDTTSSRGAAVQGE